MECPNGVLGKILHTLKGDLDIAIRGGTIVGPILMTFQLYGEKERERERERERGREGGGERG